MSSNVLAELDRAHLIHSVMSWKAHEKAGPTVLRSGRGAYLTDNSGREFLDGFAGLWCVNAGYGQESIIRAMTEQIERLPYATTYFGYGSEPAIRLAARVAELAPGALNHVFFTLGGSDAIDTAVRFLRFYAHASRRPEKRHVISVEKGYHGSSSTGAGLTALPAFHKDSELPLPWQHYIPSPYPYRNSARDAEAIIAASVAALNAKVAELGRENVVAFFCEPVQGSGGVIVPPAGWLKAIREACRKLDILFLADEVITGFGRTGTFFGCEFDGVEPDLMTIAKGLTSGYSPMGAVIISDHVYETIRDARPDGVPIGHGLTYSGHPVSAAAGLAALDLYLDGGLLANGQRMGDRLLAGLGALADHPLVGEVRGRGMLAALELVTDKPNKTKPDRSLRVAEQLSRLGSDNRIIFRAFADDIIGLAPPLCCTAHDIDLIVERVGRTLDDLLDIPEIRRAAT